MKRPLFLMIFSCLVLLFLTNSQSQASSDLQLGRDCQAVYNQTYLVSYNYAILKLNYDEIDAAAYARGRAGAAYAEYRRLAGDH